MPRSQALTRRSISQAAILHAGAPEDRDAWRHVREHLGLGIALQTDQGGERSVRFNEATLVMEWYDLATEQWYPLGQSVQAAAVAAAPTASQIAASTASTTGAVAFAVDEIPLVADTPAYAVRAAIHRVVYLRGLALTPSTDYSVSGLTLTLLQSIPTAEDLPGTLLIFSVWSV